MKVTVTPKSNKAKNRFHNLMGKNPNVTIHRQVGTDLFLASENLLNFFWVPIGGNNDWSVNITQ